MEPIAVTRVDAGLHGLDAVARACLVLDGLSQRRESLAASIIAFRKIYLDFNSTYGQAFFRSGLRTYP